MKVWLPLSSSRHILFFRIACNLAVLVASHAQVLDVGARTHKVSGEVEDERKKKKLKKNKGREKTMLLANRTKTKKKQEMKERKKKTFCSLGKVPRSVPPRVSSDTAPWAASKPITEVDRSMTTIRPLFFGGFGVV